MLQAPGKILQAPVTHGKMLQIFLLLIYIPANQSNIFGQDPQMVCGIMEVTALIPNTVN